MAKKNWDWVSPAGALMAIFFLNGNNFMIFKKMRIMGTENISAFQSLGSGYNVLLGLTAFLFFVTLIMEKNLWLKRSAGLFTGLIIAGIFYFSAGALDNTPWEKTVYSRLSLGLDMWFALICYAIIIIKVNEKEKCPPVRLLITFFPIVLIGLLIYTGQLNNLGIMMEYYTYKKKFYIALIRHANISLAVIFTGILTGIPLGYLANKSIRWERGIIPFINIIETLPAISLITIIMIPLAVLANQYPFLQKIGISGFGLAAPFVALVFYAIFPIIHNTQAAFKTIKREYIEIGKSMGMNQRQIFYKIQLPLALPVILAGIRIAMVYSISGTTLAAFIGGGGLGTFILQNDSMDFVLLGTLPIVMMTFIADSILKVVINKLLNKRIIL